MTVITYLYPRTLSDPACRRCARPLSPSMAERGAEFCGLACDEASLRERLAERPERGRVVAWPTGRLEEMSGY